MCNAHLKIAGAAPTFSLTQVAALLVTIPLSVLLALFFIVAYWKDFRWRKNSSFEQESLRPLDDDTGRAPEHPPH